jgi:hypothetical protein
MRDLPARPSVREHVAPVRPQRGLVIERPRGGPAAAGEHCIGGTAELTMKLNRHPPIMQPGAVR